MVSKKLALDSLDKLDAQLAPAYGRRSLLHPVPKYELPEHEMAPDSAYDLIHDELMLDGNARLNMATFVTTWMEPQAEKLMTEAFDKNMIDKDEYPQTAAIEERCVNIVSNLFHAPDQGVGASAIGSSEAVMSAARAKGAAPRTSPPTGRILCWAPTCRWYGKNFAATGRWNRSISPWKRGVM